MTYVTQIAMGFAFGVGLILAVAVMQELFGMGFGVTL